MEFADIFRRCLGSGKDIEVIQTGCTVFQIVREISQTFLCRDLGNLSSQTAQSLFFFQKESVTSYLSSCTGSFQTCGTSTDHNYVTVFIDFLGSVGIAFEYGRVDRTTDRTVEADTVSGTSDVTGDTFADITFVTGCNFIYPFRIRDQSTAHTDQISIAVSQDLFRNFRITDISHGDTWFAEFFFDSSWHVGTPSVLHIIGIDLILDGTVQTTGYVEDIHFFLYIFQIFQSIFQCVSTFYHLICTQAQHDRKERSYLFSDFFDDHTAETCSVFYGTTEFVSTFVSGRREKLADQIRVSCMNLYSVKTCDLRTFCSLSVFFYDIQDLVFGQRARDIAAGFGRYIRGRYRLHVDTG